MITVSKEDYLKAILEAEGEGEQVISARLAQWLSVSAPAVTMALRRLKRDGLVSVRSDGRVQLTAAGRKIARRLAIRHHLIERMLHEIFGMEWYKVHDEAERLEHAVSSDFEAMLTRKLGHGGPCPHGNSPTPSLRGPSASADCCCFPNRSREAVIRCKASMSATAGWESFWRSLAFGPAPRSQSISGTTTIP